MTIKFIRLAFEPIGYVGEVEVDSSQLSEETLSLLDVAYAKFNRGSGQEIEFPGPSASVEDLFIVVRNGDFRFKEVYQIRPVGFERLEAR